MRRQGGGKRTITFKNNIYKIGCFEGNFEESKEAIKKKYSTKEAENYVSKLIECQNMDWVDLSKLKDDSDWQVRLSVAQYSDKHHQQFKDDKPYYNFSQKIMRKLKMIKP